jgi:hypothetical protein
MTEDRDERLLRRAADVLREPTPRADDAFAEAIEAIRREVAQASMDGGAGAFRRRPRITRGAVRFAAGLAAGLAFAAGLGIGLFSGWRMRGASYQLAAEDAKQRGSGTGFTPVSDAAPGTQPVQFMFVAPGATRVALVGEFNDWDAHATPMTRVSGDAWQVALPLAAGRHVYAFVVDGTSWVSDPEAPLAPERWYGARNSVRLVSGVQRQ